MIIDARTLPAGEDIDCDLCIIGGGPAGLTLASRFIEQCLNVVLVETGGEKRNAAAENLLGGTAKNSKFAPMTMYRRRVLGGASVIWGGRCVPLDRIDFGPRSFVSNSGWPIDYDAVARYFAPATYICEAGRPDYDADIAVPSAPDYIEGFKSPILRTNSFERFSLPTNFWQRFRGVLNVASNIRVLTHATCTNLLLESGGEQIASADCATLTGQRFSVKAKRYVLAAGGVEVYRLLAASRTQRPAGIGNEYGVLGRHFMSHIEGSVASLKLRSPRTRINWGFDMTPDGIYGRRRMTIAAEEQRRAGLLNMIVRLHHENPVLPMHGNAVLSAMFLAKSLILPEYRRKITMTERNAVDSVSTDARFWLGHLKNVVVGSPRLAVFMAEWIARRNLAIRKLPYVVLPSASGVYPLDFNAEQAPNPDSRLLLAKENDRFGVPFADVDWRMADVDVTSIANTHRLMNDELQRSGVAHLEFGGRDLESHIREVATPVGGHHLGATRMGDDPRTSVVDADLRVHGVTNLFVASGSVFPTCGHANPTLTIIALALRLADHLKSIANR